MKTALLWVGLFLLTVLETWVATWEGRADRQSTSAKTNRYSWISSGWAGVFEVLLLLDIWLVVREGWTIGIPIVAGAVWGKFYALEKRRARWRANVGRGRRKRRVARAAQTDSSPSSTSDTSPSPTDSGG